MVHFKNVIEGGKIEGGENKAKSKEGIGFQKFYGEI